MALDPSNHDAGKYVTIRNFYLEDGNWQADVAMDRCEVMLEAGIKKTAARCAVRRAVLCSTLLSSLHICSQVLLKKKRELHCYIEITIRLTFGGSDCLQA
jgi:hypothetical protein